MSDKEIKPVIKADPLYQMLRQEDVDSFNASRDSMDTSELTGGDYRGRDLRKMSARGLDFSNAYFRNCDAARAAGAAPIRYGEPGYGAHLDRDGDGVACEPYRGR